MVTDRLSILLKQNRKLFHTNDLALIWNISNIQTLHTTISRYIKKGILLHIHKGFYSIAPLSDISPYSLGIAYLHRYAYVSTETVLSLEGIIHQQIIPVTLVSSVSMNFKIAGYSYLCRKIRDSALFASSGLEMKDGVLFASPERALVDMLYLNPKYHIDDRNKINWDKFNIIRKETEYDTRQTTGCDT